MKKGFLLESRFYCTCCGNEGIPIIRRNGRAQEAGHLKKLYCLHCKKEWNHAETKEFSHYTYQDFLLEFEHKNFTEEGLRKEPYSQFKQRLIKEGIVK